MRARLDTRHRGPLEVQAVYSVAALARAANVTPDFLRRLLRTNRVEMLRVGRSLVVPLSEIDAKIPSLWASIQAAELLRQGLG